MEEQEKKEPELLTTPEPALELPPATIDHKSRKVLGTIIAVVVLLLIGAGISKAAYGTFVPPALQSLFGGSQNQASLFDRMVSNLQNINSNEFSAQLSFVTEPYKDAPRIPKLDKTQAAVRGYSASISNALPSDLSYEDGMLSYQTPFADLPAGMNISITANGKSRYTDDKKNADGSINLAVHIDMGGVIMEGEGSMLKLGDIMYVQATKFPSLVADITPIKSKWVKIDLAEIARSQGIDLGSMTSRVSNPQTEQEKEDAVILEKARKIIEEEHVLATEEIDDAETAISGTVHYQLTLDQQAIIRAYTRMSKELADVSSSPAMTDEVLSYLQGGEFTQILDYLKKAGSIDVWVSKDTAMPKKFAFMMILASPDPVVGKPEQHVRIQGTMTFDSINKSVEIIAPATSITTDEATELLFSASTIGGVVGVSLDAARAKGSDAGIKDNLSSIRTLAELYYDGEGKQSYGPVTSSCSVGMFASTDISRVIKNIKSIQPKAATCKVSGTGGAKIYAISVPLVTNPATSWCVDGKGNAKIGIAGIVGTQAACK